MRKCFHKGGLSENMNKSTELDRKYRYYIFIGPKTNIINIYISRNHHERVPSLYSLLLETAYFTSHKKTQQKSKINFPQFLRCMYVCMCVCICALYRSHRLTYGAENFTTISVSTHHDAQTIIL